MGIEIFPSNDWVQTGMRNVLINGGMEVAQRGTVAATGNAYAVDRFYVYSAGANLTSHTQSTTTIPPTGSRASLGLRGASSVTSVAVGQRIESSIAYSARGVLTLSAYIYNNSGAEFTPTVSVLTADAADNFTSQTHKVNAASLQACPNGAWTRVSYTFDCSGYTNLANGMTVSIGFPAAALNTNTKYVYITNYQLERGGRATPFEVRPYGMELSLCQRYYEVCDFVANAAGAAYQNVFYKVTKRNGTLTASPSTVQGVNVNLRSLNYFSLDGLVATNAATTVTISGEL